MTSEWQELFLLKDPKMFFGLAMLLDCRSVTSVCCVSTTISQCVAHFVNTLTARGSKITGHLCLLTGLVVDGLQDICSRKINKFHFSPSTFSEIARDLYRPPPGFCQRRAGLRGERDLSLYHYDHLDRPFREARPGLYNETAVIMFSDYPRFKPWMYHGAPRGDGVRYDDDEIRGEYVDHSATFSYSKYGSSLAVACKSADASVASAGVEAPCMDFMDNRMKFGVGLARGLTKMFVVNFVPIILPSGSCIRKLANFLACHAPFLLMLMKQRILSHAENCKSWITMGPEVAKVLKSFGKESCYVPLNSCLLRKCSKLCALIGGSRGRICHLQRVPRVIWSRVDDTMILQGLRDFGHGKWDAIYDRHFKDSSVSLKQLKYHMKTKVFLKMLGCGEGSCPRRNSRRRDHTCCNNMTEERIMAMMNVRHPRTF